MNETLKRSISGAIYVLLLVTSITYSTESFLVLFGLFLIVAVYEFCNLVVCAKTIPIIFAITSYLGYVYLLQNKISYSKHFDLFILFITVFITIKSILFLFNKNEKPLSKFNTYQFLIGYVILPFILITKIPFGIKGYNPKILISIFILIWTNDTFAYIVGKSIGKNKLFERISPKKTIEGFIGGVLFAIAASFFISKYYIGGAQNIWIIIAIIVGFFGTVGDLIESKFKRMAGVKDSGKIMPGHGGILDRLDSVIFVAPIVFIFYQILYYVS